MAGGGVLDLAELLRLQNRIRDQLDDADGSEGAEKGRHLQLAIRASRAAVELVLTSDDFWSDASDVAAAGAENGEAVARIIEDNAVFEMFLAAERRLLLDMGMRTALVDEAMVAMRALRYSITVGPADVTDSRDKIVQLREILNSLNDELAEAADHLSSDEHHRRWRRIIRGSLEAIAGVGVIGANAAGVLATLGLGAPAGAVSIGAGGAIVGDGLARANRAA